MRNSFFVLAGLAACAFALSACAQDHQHKMKEGATVEADARRLVKFPEPMRLHTITGMRDPLFALQEINVALSRITISRSRRVRSKFETPTVSGPRRLAKPCSTRKSKRAFNAL
jgi:hypothetical protein